MGSWSSPTSKTELFDLDEPQLMNVIMDQADKPCGKSFPQRLVRAVGFL